MSARTRSDGLALSVSGPLARVVDTAEQAVGELRFRSPLWFMVVPVMALGIAGAIIQRIPLIGVGAGVLAVLMIVYGCASVQRIVVTGGHAEAIRGRLSLRPTPLSHYRYVRCYHAPKVRAFDLPDVLVMYAASHAHPLAKLRGRCRPGANGHRAIVFFSRWRDEHGRLGVGQRGREPDQDGLPARRSDRPSARLVLMGGPAETVI